MIGWLIADVILACLVAGMVIVMVNFTKIREVAKQSFAPLSKTCYGCKYFGRCAVANFYCEDFQPDDGKLTTMNIAGFTQEWRRKHPYCRVDADNTIRNARALRGTSIVVNDFAITADCEEEVDGEREGAEE